MERKYEEKLTRRYFCRRGKRIYVPEIRGLEGRSGGQLAKCNYTCELEFNLPYMLTDKYVTRHQLSINDIQKIFKDVPVRYLWMLALYKGFDITSSALQPCYANNTAITFSGNTIIMKKLVRYYEASFKFSMIDKIIHPKDDHCPRLPIHVIPLSLFQQLIGPLEYFKKHQKYTETLSWAEIQVIPIEWYQGYLKLVRILPKMKYISHLGEADTLAHYPVERIIGNQVYFETEEAFLVQTQTNHDKLMEGGDPELAIPMVDM